MEPYKPKIAAKIAITTHNVAAKTHTNSRPKVGIR